MPSSSSTIIGNPYTRDSYYSGREDHSQARHSALDLMDAIGSGMQAIRDEQGDLLSRFLTHVESKLDPAAAARRKDEAQQLATLHQQLETAKAENEALKARISMVQESLKECEQRLTFAANSNLAYEDQLQNERMAMQASSKYLCQ